MYCIFAEARLIIGLHSNNLMHITLSRQHYGHRRNHLPPRWRHWKAPKGNAVIHDLFIALVCGVCLLISLDKNIFKLLLPFACIIGRQQTNYIHHDGCDAVCGIAPENKPQIMQNLNLRMKRSANDNVVVRQLYMSSIKFNVFKN